MTAAGQTAAALNDGDPGFYFIVSPFSSFAITNPNFGANIAGFASTYSFSSISLPLSLASLCRRKSAVCAPLVCIAFGLLAGLQIRLIPFYAPSPRCFRSSISPIMPAGRAASPRFPAAASASRRLMTLSFLLLAVFLAWPGWLHLGLAQFQEDSLFQSNRRVDWELEPDPSLHQAAWRFKKRSRREIHNVLNFDPKSRITSHFSRPKSSAASIYAWRISRRKLTSTPLYAMISGRTPTNSSTRNATNQARLAKNVRGMERRYARHRQLQPFELSSFGPARLRHVSLTDLVETDCRRRQR